MTEINDATHPQHHFAFCVQYHGGAFRGWQRQHGQASIQGELERALGTIANEPIALRAAGRTDAGVHGTGQIAAFSTSADRPVAQWLRGVNGLTPASIQVSWFKPVAAEFHPRFDAVARRYTYLKSRQYPAAMAPGHQKSWVKRLRQGTVRKSCRSADSE